MEQKREIHVDDVKNLVGKLLTLVEATVPEGNQEATKQLVTQTIWSIFNVVGNWEELESTTPKSKL